GTLFPVLVLLGPLMVGQYCLVGRAAPRGNTGKQRRRAAAQRRRCRSSAPLLDREVCPCYYADAYPADRDGGGLPPLDAAGPCIAYVPVAGNAACFAVPSFLRRRPFPLQAVAGIVLLCPVSHAALARPGDHNYCRGG